jgi:hypothetical protein
MSDAAHIETSQLIAFMLDDAELTRAENTHLFYCSVCSCAMIEASVEELLRREEVKAGRESRTDPSLATLRDGTGS